MTTDFTSFTNEDWKQFLQQLTDKMSQKHWYAFLSITASQIEHIPCYAASSWMLSSGKIIVSASAAESKQI